MTARCPECGDPFPHAWITDEDCEGLAMNQCLSCGCLYWNEQL